MKVKEIVCLVKPLYKKMDRMHNFKHILRIKRKVAKLRKGYKKIDEDKLRFLAYFHGLKHYVKENQKKIVRMGFPKEYIKALYRHTKKPKTIEEKLVSDANKLESVGKFGIKRALQVGKERNQTREETLTIMQRNISKVKFYTKEGKRLGNPGIKILEHFLESTRAKAEIRTLRQTQSKKGSISDLEFHSLTLDRWKDLEELFGERGACGGCWCMWWRLTRSEFERQKGSKNKAALKKIVRSGQVPGILAYARGKSIAWCSVGPRVTYPALERSRVLRRVDDRPVWSVVCLFVAKPFRNKGVSVKMLKAAVDYAKKKGAKIVEGYPKEPKKGRWPDAFIWTGHVSAFQKAGFVEVHRGSPTRPIMRYYVEKKK